MRGRDRNYGCRISDQFTLNGLKLLVMENERLRVSLVLDKGTDIFEFLYKPLDVDFMWRSPLGLPSAAKLARSLPPGIGAFLDNYEGGWQEVLPNGGFPCIYKGIDFGLHDETPLLPWSCVILEDTPDSVSARCWVRTRLTPFYVEKTLTLRSGEATLTIEEEVINEGEEELELTWGHHVALGEPFLDETCELTVPARTVITHPVEWSANNRLKPDQKCPWPNVTGKNGGVIDLTRIPSREAKAEDQAYLTDLDEGWYALTNTSRNVGFALSWPKDVFPYIWFWQVYKGGFGYPWYGRTYNIGLEPFSSYPNTGLEGANKTGTQIRLGPGESIKATLKASVFEGAYDGKISG
ncbi:MAG: DUF4432 family protein [Armatimonadetes bacterium]|nr:DUF4432 family protein [Armatimonadota bacterium]